jgi:hypothetical protein
MKQPFKRDEAKERLLVWKATRPDLWQNVSASMKEDVDRYDQAKQAAEQAAARAGLAAWVAALMTPAGWARYDALVACYRSGEPAELQRFAEARATSTPEIES